MSDPWNLENPTPGQIAAAKHLLKNWSGFNVEWDELGEPGKRLLLMSAWDTLKAAGEADTKPPVDPRDVATMNSFCARPAMYPEVKAAWSRIRQALHTQGEG